MYKAHKSTQYSVSICVSYIGLEKLACVRETLKAIPKDSIETITRYEQARVCRLFTIYVYEYQI